MNIHTLKERWEVFTILLLKTVGKQYDPSKHKFCCNDCGNSYIFRLCKV